MRKFNLGDKVAHKANVIGWAAGTSVDPKISEIYQVNEAYEWVTDTVKTQLKKDFQGLEEDLQKIQDVIDSGVLSPKKKEPWLAFGIAICTILMLIASTGIIPALFGAMLQEVVDTVSILWALRALRDRPQSTTKDVN